MRTILFVLALLGAVAGRAQIFLDWYGAAAPAAGLLLDDYQNAAAAWSLRLLRTGYTGNCIQVRRSSNNATQDIGFAGGVVDTASLKTFCASTDCFIRTWYDQSGNSRNLTQTTLSAQPLIVSAGSIIRQDGEPAIDFDGTTDALANGPVSNFITNSTYSSFTVALLDTITSDANDSYSNNGIFADAGGYMGLYARRNANRLLFFNWDGNDDRASININIDTEYIIHQRHESGNIVGSVNNSTEASVLSGNTSVLTSTFTVGAGFSTRMNGTIKELVFWNTSQSGNITGIYTNINSFYNTY
jgi:hypothetical protein